MNRIKDLTGRAFGRLRVLNLAEIVNKRSRWLCKCICGNTCIVSNKHLIGGQTKSCGCLQKECLNNRKTHGLSNTRFYKIWGGMKHRCLNKKAGNYHKYGGQGITVCDNWLDFNNFKEDMYESYLEHCKLYGEKDTTLDRIDANKNYEPKNCRWATYSEQNYNRFYKKRDE